MARLIDADELLKYKTDHEMISTHLIYNAPTVDAEPVRHAYWIRHEDWEEEGGCGWECSECGMGSEVDYKYCMRCGARMVEDGQID